MWPKKLRLGKRSPLGVLLGAPYPAGGAPTGWDPAEGSTASATGAGQHHSGRVKGHPVLKVSEPLEPHSLGAGLDVTKSRFKMVYESLCAHDNIPLVVVVGYK